MFLSPPMRGVKTTRSRASLALLSAVGLSLAGCSSEPPLENDGVTEPLALSGGTCGTAQESKQTTLSCPSGTISKVLFASYGLPRGGCGAFAEGACRSETSKSEVEAACLGKASCTLTADNATFGDPCPGKDKRLYVEVECTSASPVPAPAPAPAPAPKPVPGDALPTDAVFAPGSFWYSPIPANAPLHASSAAYVADFKRQMKAYYGNVNINTTAYASPVFIAGAATPTVKVAIWDCQNKGYSDASLAQQWAAVPIPTNAAPSEGTDLEMTIYQPSTDQIFEFWQTRKVDGNWEACWGGQMKNASSNQGIWPGNYGTTATSLPFLGGQITAEELRRGEIRHAIGIALVDLENYSVVSWPATRSDGYNPDHAPNRIPEGSRFRLDPTVNLDTLGLHPVAKIIAKAAQKYGFVVWDKAGSISIRAQNSISYTSLGQPDPYNALFNGTPSYAVLSSIPWDRLQFLPKDYGKP